MDDDRDRIGFEPQGARRRLVVDLGDVADLDEMVARAQRAELPSPPLQRALRQKLRPGARQAPALLDPIQIGGRAEAARDRPCRAAGQDLPEIFLPQAEILPVRSDSRRDPPEELENEVLDPGLEGFAAQT